MGCNFLLQEIFPGLNLHFLQKSYGPNRSKDIKKRRQEHTEELYKKDLHDQDNNDCVITHLEPDILECKVKWALGTITTNKASGADGIPVELFQILKDDAVKVLHSICQQIWKTQQWPQDWKRSVFISIPNKGNAKECSNYCTVTVVSHASKVMLKIAKPGFSSMWTMNFQMFKLDLEKAEEPEVKLPTVIGSLEKQENSRKHLFLLYWLCQSLWRCGSQKIVENSERDGNTRPPDLPPEKTICRSISNS